MGFQFNRDAAQKTESNVINESGVYKGVLTAAVEKTFESGSQCITFSFKDCDDKVAKNITVFTVKKDGTPSFGANHIQSLMGILEILNASPVTHVDNIGKSINNYDCFCNRKIAVALQRVNTPNQKFSYKMKILHFFDYNTLQNYKEKTNALPAKVSTCKIEDTTDLSGTSTKNNTANFDDTKVPIDAYEGMF